MPISQHAVGKCPLNPFQIQALNNLRVLKHISVVIVVDESIPDGLAEHQPDGTQEKQANNNYRPVIARPPWKG
jgi:hypothetical protein